MSRRSGRPLAFKDAVRILDDGSPFVRQLDELITHAFEAVPAGNLVALPYFAFRAKLVDYGTRLVHGIRDRVDGVGRYDRTQRLHAAHAVIVMTAFAEALGEMLDGVEPQVVQLSESAGARNRRIRAHRDLVLYFRDDAVPGPADIGQPFRRVSEVEEYLRHLASAAVTLIEELGLRDKVMPVADPELASRAVRRYEEYYRRLVDAAPEFAVWAYLSEHATTRADLGELGAELRARLDMLTTGLAGVPAVLAEVSGQAAANRVRAELARAYQAVLARSVLGEARAPAGVALPTLENGYVNPAVRAAVIDADCRPSEDGWWEDQPSYDNVQTLIVGALTIPEAVGQPLIILGQPGAGKSVLTRMLAARLADRGFLPVRVELRNVPADADLQTQIEYAVRATIGRSIEWPDLAGSARRDGLLPLIILDGFDELLQATGVNRTDFLEQVAHFQQRELDQDRPVAAIVTSRTAVADRARFPEATTTLRIEPFDEARVTTWLRAWNEVNGWSLDPETMLRYGELAEQPLLLTLLALYDAGSGVLASTEAELSRAELYDRLLSEFTRREVRKSDEGMDPKQEDREVAKELLGLEIVALAMFNRHAKAITGEELDRDLAVLLPDDHQRAPGGSGLAKPLTAAQLMVGRFFFVHESSAQRAEETEHAYEFLHATFGEFLVARYVVEILRSLARLRAFQESEGMVSALDDGKLWAALSFAALTGSKASVEFTEGLLQRLPDEERAAVRELTVELVEDAEYPNPRRSLTDYEPDRVAVLSRYGCYSANLVVLAILSTGDPLHFHPLNLRVAWEALTYQDFIGLQDTVRVLRLPGADRIYLRIVREDGSAVVPAESVISLQNIGRDAQTGDQLFAGAAVSADSTAGLMIRRKAFSSTDDWSLDAVEPYLRFAGDEDLSSDENHVPLARGLLELRLAPFRSHGVARRLKLYEWCFANWDLVQRPWPDTVFRQLREDIREFAPSDVVALLGYALEKHALDRAPGGFLDVLRALRDVDETAFQELVDTDDRLRQLVTDDPQK